MENQIIEYLEKIRAFTDVDRIFWKVRHKGGRRALAKKLNKMVKEGLISRTPNTYSGAPNQYRFGPKTK